MTIDGISFPQGCLSKVCVCDFWSKAAGRRKLFGIFPGNEGLRDVIP